MKISNSKHGISLIVLVITIIVIIILAGAVILSLSKNNPIAQSNEATYKSNLNAYSSELAMAISSKYAQDFTFNPKSLYAKVWDTTNSDVTGTVKQYISSMKAEDAPNYIIAQGKLVYIGKDATQIQWTKDLGITDGLTLSLNGSDFLNSPQTTSWIDKSGSTAATPINFGYTATSGSDGLGAIAFDGVDDYINTDMVLGSNIVTLSAWVKPSDMSKDYSGIIGDWWWSGITGGHQINIGLHNDKLNARIYSESNNEDIFLESTSALTLNTWSHVALTVDDTGMARIYLNGAEVGNAAVSIKNIIHLKNIVIGTWRASMDAHFSRPYKGSMDDVRIYCRALSSAEILQLYSLGR